MVEYTRIRMDYQGHFFHIFETIHEGIFLDQTCSVYTRGYIVKILPGNHRLPTFSGITM